MFIIIIFCSVVHNSKMKLSNWLFVLLLISLVGISIADSENRQNHEDPSNGKFPKSHTLISFFKKNILSFQIDKQANDLLDEEEYVGSKEDQIKHRSKFFANKQEKDSDATKKPVSKYCKSL
jgi:hypothetical protein